MQLRIPAYRCNYLCLLQYNLLILGGSGSNSAAMIGMSSGGRTARSQADRSSFVTSTAGAGKVVITYFDFRLTTLKMYLWSNCINDLQFGDCWQFSSN